MDLWKVRDFAAEQYRLANQFARQIHFVERREKKAHIAKRSMEIRASIADDAEFAALEIGDGIAAWTSILAVDLRESTVLADTLGPRDTYLMTHTLLPTLVHVCESLGGSVMNLRGDGLFSSFGLKKLAANDGSDEPSDDEIAKANRAAVGCGLSLIEATRYAVQVVLEAEGIEASLSVGAGVDCGHVVVTRVGWMNASELTAYGSSVNHACKLSNRRNQVQISRDVEHNYPTSPDGKLSLQLDGEGFTVTSNTRQLETS